MKKAQSHRRYPIGAELIGANETHFRLWAPKAKTIEVVTGHARELTTSSVAGEGQKLESEANGYFSGGIRCGAGTRYKFRVNGGEAFPDPASRYQPDGPHGASCVIDPFAFPWTDAKWRGLQLAGQIVYEFHVGTFTPEGTWRAAISKLPELKDTGVTLLEMMPIADFAGRFGWGYDGVDLFAPCRLYGMPDDLRAFVSAAHEHGLGVILDVVYNHFGPDGNYLGIYSDDYVRHDLPKEWGDPTNFDGANSAPVREFFITNGRYWIEEFHFDGFRFDATQGIHDRSEEYIVGAIGRAARAAAAGRSIVLIAENEPQETKLVRPRSEGGDDLNGLWNDDWHHSALVALTGRNEAYLTDYRGAPQEFISAAKYGYLYQGQPYVWQEAPRGYPALGIAPETFVSFLENHDQVANSAFGTRVRLQTSPGAYRAMTALLLLGPWTPLLFQGEEFGATTPFLYFAEVGDEGLREAIRKGRFEFLAQFPSAVSDEIQGQIAIPHDEKTFRACKLDWAERERGGIWLDLHRDLIRLRRKDARLRRQIAGGIDGAVLGEHCFLLRFLSEDAADSRLLIINLGARMTLSPLPEPLLAPPADYIWETLWTSESARYGGPGVVEIDPDEQWMLAAQAALLFRPRKRTRPRKKPQIH